MRYRIDWLTVSLNEDHYPKADDYKGADRTAVYVGRMLMKDFVRLTKVEHPAAFYEASYSDPMTGARFDFSSKPEQGSRLVLPGAFWSANGGCWYAVFKLIVEDVQAKVTRIDLALDYEHEESAADVWLHWEQPNSKGRPRNAVLYESGKGNTFTIGSRSSERYVRLYDKGEKEKSVLHDWRRLEVELKGRTADYYAKQIAADKSVMLRVLRDTLAAPRSVPHAILTGLLDDDTSAEPLPVRPKPPAVEWYELQVIPALQKLYKTDRNAYWHVIDLIKEALDDLGYE